MSHLSPEQVQRLRSLLEEKLERLSAYNQKVVDVSPVNDPDRLESNESGDDAQEEYGILESEALERTSGNMIREVQGALQRMDEGTYGLDVNTAEPIPYQRLLLLPEARTASTES